MRMTLKFVSKAGLIRCKANLTRCEAGQNNCEACLGGWIWSKQARKSSEDAQAAEYAQFENVWAG